MNKLGTNWNSKISALIEDEKTWTCGSKAAEKYIIDHKIRFEKLFVWCKTLFPSSVINVLDIGKSPLTLKLESYYQEVMTLGFDLENDNGGHREKAGQQPDKHIVFDLNQSNNVDLWPPFANKFDLIVFSETLEHLHISPVFILIMFNYLLKPGGKIILSTPNAVTIRNRLSLLFGTNPFESIRLFSENPGHFREYTKNELIGLGLKAEFQSVKVHYSNFYASRYLFLLKQIPSFSDSLVAVYTK